MVLWIKVAHIISIIAWMAAMLYLPRLMVYHCDAKEGSDLSETLKIMERRLVKAIMTPAMISSWIFGLWLAYLIDAWADIWFNLKFVLVFAMTALHGVFSGWTKKFASDQNTRSQKFYRAANEVPTVLMMVIVILVVVKPF